MSRADEARLADITDAIQANHDHLTKGGLDESLVYDAVRVRLIEIGEAAAIVEDIVTNELGPLMTAVQARTERLAQDSDDEPTP